MIYQMKMLIPSGKPITPSSSIFVEIQNGWFNTEGIFLKMYFFLFFVLFFLLNLVAIVEFCLKNLLSEKHWPKCLSADL